MNKKIGTPNRSFTYILPMLGDKITDFYLSKSSPKSQFRNCFVGDKEKPEMENKILLLYRFAGTPEYLKFEESLKQHKQFDSMYEPDRYHTMYVFNVPEEYLAEYKDFILGKYSKFKKSYKDKIQKFHNLLDNDHVMNVLYKREQAYRFVEDLYGIAHIPRHQEASSIPNMDDEMYSDIYRIVDSMKENELYKDFD